MEKQIVETKYGDYTISIMYDDDAPNPRTDWEPFGKMICFHRRYNLGDKHNYLDPDDFLFNLSNWDEDKDGEFNAVKAQEKINKDNVMLPLFLYDHSGITMSTSPFGDRWDSGQVGWIYASKNEICENWCVSDWNDMIGGSENGEDISAKQRAKSLLKAEVETYDEFLTGRVYRFQVIDPDGEQIDSCSAYFGDHETSGLLDDANAAIDNDVERKDAQEAEDLHKAGCLVYSERV